jgi:putative heme-binding domain-containing protein
MLLLFLVPSLFAPGQSKDKPKWEASPHIAATDPLPPEQQLKKFHLPPGFEIQLVAADPDVRKPINIAFDAAGRLWVTGSIEYPFPAAPGKGRDTVKILEDFGPDGKARKITTFADGLNIPIGVLPVGKDAALVYSIPSVYRVNPAGRQVVLTGYGFRDTHGMTGEFVRGFDGWVYACHGFSNTSTVKNVEGKPTITMSSGNTYRFYPSGERVEYFTHGQVNPFGLCFDPYGNIYSADCHTRPLYQLLRGAWYPSFGAPHDGLGFGPEMVTHDHGSTAIAGVNFYAADQYPEAFRGNLFVGNVVTNRINRDRLERHGSTYKGIEMPDFVKCDDPWFRPVDIKLGPDGCLYVADFYTRIIGHYEVPLNHPARDFDKGRIWRIVYRGPDGKGGPQPFRDLLKMSVAELVKELNSPNLEVRLHATHEIVARGKALNEQGEALVREAALKGSPYEKVHGLWALHRLSRLDDPTLAAAAHDAEPTVRTHAQRVLTDRAKLSAADRALVLAGLKDSDAFVQRCAAEALGAHPQAENVAPLLELRHRVPGDDTHLLHAVRMALRDQLRHGETWQLDLARLPDKDQRAIADVCPGVHNPQASEFLFTVLPRFDVPREVYHTYVHTIVRYIDPERIPAVANLIHGHFAADLPSQAAMLQTLQQASQERGRGPGEVEVKLAENLAQALLASPAPQGGIDLAGAFRLTSAQPTLIALARNPKMPEPVRKSAVGTAITLGPAVAVKALAEILRNDAETIAVREQVATALAGTNNPDAHDALVKTMEAAPARLQTVIALGLAGSPKGGEKLLDAVGKGKASPRLLQDRGVELKLRQTKLADLDQRLAKLTKGLPAADQRIAELIGKRRAAFLASKGDMAAGVKVYEKHCANCHQIANKGAKIGPQLDGIGIRGVERLLEDMLDPNRNVDQAFRSTTLVLDNGQFVSGLVLREEGQVIIVADAQGKEQRVQKGAVAERIVSQLSPMPSNFAEMIGEADLNNLLAFLLAQRVKE